MSNHEIYKEINAILESHDHAALVTIISASHSTPRRAGSKMLVKSDGSIMGTIGGGAVEAEAINIALDCIASGKSKKHHFSLIPDDNLGMICGGEMEVFFEPIVSTPVIIIFGAGHISRALAKFGKLLGFKTVVIDDRKDYATKERFPDADQLLVDDFENVFLKLHVDRRSYIVIVTRGHRHDEAVLRKAIDTPARYIGMIGSKSKVKTIMNNLRTSGIDDHTIDRIYSPIGIDINAETPEEIAVSIIAQIIKVYRSDNSTK